MYIKKFKMFENNNDRNYIKKLTFEEYKLYGDEMQSLTNREIEMIKSIGLKHKPSSEKQVVSIFKKLKQISVCKVNDGYFIVSYYNNRLNLCCFLLDGINTLIKFLKRL